ncbi:hypothetical protein IFR05_015797 [Cadophora sp. M221]|nr:hypothetical protein IFR05_015797 [Cadophora sp. M221]
MDLPNTNSNILPTRISNGNRNSYPDSDLNRSSTVHNPNQIPNAKANANPFSDPTLPQPNPQLQTDLLTVSRSGTTLVTNITKYLSTLPHPIEIVEELVAVCAVTASLLLSLNSALARFPHLNLSSTHSFIAPLCHDILFAFKLLADRVQESKRLRVFEPNSVGLVRLPRSAWILVLGTEAKVAALRSRLYVEKYRVRVLIEAVTWEGLRALGVGRRSKREEDELRSLRRMVPLIAERLVGVQRDYKPRLMRLAGLVVDEGLVIPEAVGRMVGMKTVVVPAIAVKAPAQAPVLTPNQVVQAKVEVKREITQETCNEKDALRSSNSSNSLGPTSTPSRSAFPLPLPLPPPKPPKLTSTSAPMKSDTIHETWFLCCSRPKKDLKSRTSILGIPLLSTHTYSPPTYYVKPSFSSPSETASLLKSCCQATAASASPAEHIAHLRHTVLSMPQDAQWEIQKLVEARERACSSEKVRRSWEVVGLMERNCEDQGGKWLRMKSEKKIVEWVLVLKGQTEDYKERVLPGKHDNAWKDLDQAASASPTAGNANAQQAHRTVPGPVQQQQGTVIRHVENRRVLSPEEAEVKMREIISDLFIRNEEETDLDSEDDEEGDEESDEDGDENESEIEDEDASELENENQQNAKGRD